MFPDNIIELTQRESAIARQAARIVIDELRGRDEDIANRAAEKVIKAFEGREETIAKRASELAIKNFYSDVGRGFFTKLSVVIGTAVFSYAHGKGWIASLLK